MPSPDASIGNVIVATLENLNFICRDVANLIVVPGEIGKMSPKPIAANAPRTGHPVDDTSLFIVEVESVIGLERNPGGHACFVWNVPSAEQLRIAILRAACEKTQRRKYDDHVL